MSPSKEPSKAKGVVVAQSDSSFPFALLLAAGSLKPCGPSRRKEASLRWERSSARREGAVATRRTATELSTHPYTLLTSGACARLRPRGAGSKGLHCCKPCCAQGPLLPARRRRRAAQRSEMGSLQRLFRKACPLLLNNPTSKNPANPSALFLRLLGSTASKIVSLPVHTRRQSLESARCAIGWTGMGQTGWLNLERLAYGLDGSDSNPRLAGAPCTRLAIDDNPKGNTVPDWAAG